MRYAYRLKGQSPVTMDYAAKAPATKALHDHITSLKQAEDHEGWYSKSYAERKKIVKEIAALDYELITYVLVEKPKLESLEEDSAWLGHLENAGVDNWEGISYAYDLKRESGDEDEE